MKLLTVLLTLLVSVNLWASDFECEAALLEIDKTASWGFQSIEPSSTEIIRSGQNDNGNNILAVKHIFKDQKMEVYTTVDSSNTGPDWQWSDFTVTLVGVKGNKKKILGQVHAPNSEGYSDMGNAVTLQVGNSLVLEKLVDIPGALSNTADQTEIMARLNNGDIPTAFATCTRK